MTKQSNDGVLVYIGTYTRGQSEGIYVCRMDPSSGALGFASKAAEVDNPSFLALHPHKPYLYAVTEVGESAGRPSGVVTAFAADAKTGELTFLNEQPSHGPGPCYLSVDKTGTFVLVANYGGGSLAVLPIQDDGQLGSATDFVQHRGSSVDPRRQRTPHAHCIILDPSNRYAFAVDLGLDKIMIYELDLNHGKLTPNREPWVQVKAGAGPRHLTFHPNGTYAYVLNELDSTLTAFTYDDTRGTLREAQTISTLPEGFKGTNHCADLHVSPSGRFVYGSNRGHDSIVVFAVDEDTGELTYVDHEPTQGREPRSFVIDPHGTFLLAANQHSDTIVTFRVDQQTGRLISTGRVAEVPTPVCLKMLAVPSQVASIAAGQCAEAGS